MPSMHSALQTADAFMPAPHAAKEAVVACFTHCRPRYNNWLIGASQLHVDVAMVSLCLQKVRFMAACAVDEVSDDNVTGGFFIADQR